MTDKEKEPYVKLSEEFKKNFLANKNSDDSEEKILSKKRRKKRRTIIEDINNKTEINYKLNNNTLNKKNNNINLNKNPTESFSKYTTNNFAKEKVENKLFEKKKIIDPQNNNIEKNEGVKKEEDKKEKIKKNENNKIMINKDSLDKMNEYLNSVLIPFVVKSFDFIKSFTINNKE